MGSDIEKVEERSKSFLIQLRTEYGLLDRLVYKNKNQHRRCSYFQHLLKVRRDLRLLQSTKLEELLKSSFEVIHGKRPSQKLQLLESLKRRRCDGGKHNFLERLLGVARLLSQMVEPMIKAAIEISTLLAQSFFMGFSVTILALLARLRVLVQQILLDIILVFNSVSSMSQKEQAVKLTQEGLEVFREYYPRNEYVIYLECVWETDKFVLVERINKSEMRNRDRKIGADISSAASTIQYQSIEAWLGDDPGKVDPGHASEGGLSRIEERHTSSLVAPVPESNDGKEVQDGSAFERPPVENLSLESGLVTSSSPIKLNRESNNKVAFVSVKKHMPSTTTQEMGISIKEIVGGSNDKNDPIFNLLSDGSHKSSLF